MTTTNDTLAKLAGRLLEHARVHDNLVEHSEEQKQWGQDLRDAAAALTVQAPAASESMVIQMLVAAEHVTQAKVDEAIAIAVKTPGVSVQQAAQAPVGWQDLAARCLSAMQAVVHFRETGLGRPPEQTCSFEIQELQAMLASRPQPEVKSSSLKTLKCWRVRRA